MTGLQKFHNSRWWLLLSPCAFLLWLLACLWSDAVWRLLRFIAKCTGAEQENWAYVRRETKEFGSYYLQQWNRLVLGKELEKQMHPVLKSHLCVQKENHDKTDHHQ